MKYIFLLLILPNWIFAQKKTFEIFGNITGEYKKNIYFFYENDFSHKDSISAPIKDGRFYFKAESTLPILCRFHFGENSNVQELYIDGTKTYIYLACTLSDMERPDSLGGPRSKFDLVNIKGSSTEEIIRSFEAWKLLNDRSDKSPEQKENDYFARLQYLVSKNNKSRVSPYLIVGRIYLFGESFMYRGGLPLHYSEVKQLSMLIDTSLHSTIEWENLLGIMDYLDNERRRSVGSLFTDVILKDTTGNNVDTKRFTNKYLLVDFWASWCKPCRAGNPELKIIYEKYKEKGFEIVGVSMDSDKKAWKKAINEDGLQWTQLIDEKSFDGTLAKYYDISGIPVKILLNKENRIIGFDLSSEEIINLLDKELYPNKK